WYSNYLNSLGRHDEAVKEIKTAQQLEPFSLIINSGVGYSLYFSRRYDEAVTALQKTLELDPNFIQTRVYLGPAYERKGMFEDAIAELQKARRLKESPEIIARLGFAFAAAGRSDDAEKVLEDLKELSKRRYVSSYISALAYTGLGR